MAAALNIVFIIGFNPQLNDHSKPSELLTIQARDSINTSSRQKTFAPSIQATFVEQSCWNSLLTASPPRHLSAANDTRPKSKCSKD